MKALTVCEPLASAIVFGGKQIENRTRRLPLHGAVIIHAGKNTAWYQCADLVHRVWPECPANPTAALHHFYRNHGLALGVAWFDGGAKFEDLTSPMSSNVWATGPYCHFILGVEPITPFPLRGARGVFIVLSTELPEEVIAAADRLYERFGGTP